MSLTALAKLLTGKQYSIAGPKYFKYKGAKIDCSEPSARTF